MAHNLWVAGGAAVGRGVIDALPRVGDEHDYLILMPVDAGYEQLEPPTRARRVFFRRGLAGLSQWRFEAFGIPALVREFKPDVLWGLGNFGLARPGCKQAFLNMKPHFLYESKYHLDRTWRSRLTNHLALRRLKRSLPATQLVFCQTQTAAERFRRFLGYSGRIAIMPPAISRPAAQGDARWPAALEGHRGKFVLFCLTKYYAHKNLEMLVETFRRYRADLSDVVIVTTVSADQHSYAPRFLASLDDPAVRGHVVNIGPVAPSELKSYYTACQGMILPTLLESFSSTYIEAVSFQTPILTSDLDFARDACGPAAIYFDPFDPTSIRDAILELKDAPGKREELIEAGARRLRESLRSWDDIVADALGELRQLVDGDTNRDAGIPIRS